MSQTPAVPKTECQSSPVGASVHTVETTSQSASGLGTDPRSEQALRRDESTTWIRSFSNYWVFHGLRCSAKPRRWLGQPASLPSPRSGTTRFQIPRHTWGSRLAPDENVT